MTMSPLYPCGKPRSTGTHNEIVKSKQWRKFSFLSGGASAVNFPSQEKCFCLTYFAGRPDVNRVLKCAKKAGISDFKTIYILQKLIEKDKNIS